MSKIINISESKHFKDWYQTLAERVAERYPDYTIIVDGGSYRAYDSQVELKREKKEIHLDFYLPYYFDCEEQISFILSELKKWGA